LTRNDEPRRPASTFDGVTRIATNETTLLFPQQLPSFSLLDGNRQRSMLAVASAIPV
jgi:hypothetical protein